MPPFFPDATRWSFLALLVGILSLPPVAPATPVSPSTTTPFADSLQEAYAAQSVDTVRDLLDRASTPTHTWMARYRLYPLTEEEDVLGDPPSDPDDLDAPDATQLALLSGIWAYKAGETNMFNAIRYGRRSVDFLEAARAENPNNPYVLLVGGQSFLFRPSIAGKDVPKAIDRFERLVEMLETAPDEVPGISLMEAQTWLWLALREDGQSGRADAMHETVLAGGPPPLYRKFLDDPPEV
jgi:hypothetical protein